MTEAHTGARAGSDLGLPADEARVGTGRAVALRPSPPASARRLESMILQDGADEPTAELSFRPAASGVFALLPSAALGPRDAVRASGALLRTLVDRAARSVLLVDLSEGGLTEAAGAVGAAGARDVLSGHHLHDGLFSRGWRLDFLPCGTASDLEASPEAFFDFCRSVYGLTIVVASAANAAPISFATARAADHAVFVGRRHRTRRAEMRKAATLARYYGVNLDGALLLSGNGR